MNTTESKHATADDLQPGSLLLFRSGAEQHGIRVDEFVEFLRRKLAQSEDSKQ